MTNKITSARMTAMPRTLFDPMPKVYVTINGVEQFLFDFYPDEIGFGINEFIGLSLDEARRLKFTKDKNFLTS